MKDLSKFKVVDWGYTEELEPRTYQHYLDWVNKGLHAPLKYLSDERRDKRASLDLVYPEAKSALVFLFDYRSAKVFMEKLNPENKLASYSFGFDDLDYHHWIKEKLDLIAIEFGVTDYGISLDVHPVLERDLAYRAGLGWFGKNTMLLNRKFGSYFLIGSLILKEKLEFNKPSIEADHCGSCTRCIDACPTNALKERELDSQKCISTFTIETFKEEMPPLGYPTQTNEVFGCDICQEVCPWVNKTLGKESIEKSWLVDFFNRSQNEIKEEVEALSNKQFKEKFRRTSLERLGKKGLLKNLSV